MSVEAFAPSPVAWRRFLGRRLTLVVGAGILLFFLFLAIAAPLVAPYDPILQNADVRLQSPSFAHLFGTDNFGRDILSRVIWGARIDLQIAIIGVIFPFLIGTTVGTIAGFFGGIVDAVFMLGDALGELLGVHE